ncbi:MAG TPA: hypothetical protein VJT75_10840 [Thermoleophilaceae bacterium]|nr:hypothetical protein [Thermoleophilaceae bacterium]
MLARRSLLVCALVAGLSLATVYDQYRGLIPISPGKNPRVLVEELQVERNRATLHGTNGDPWQYRVGSEALAWLALRSATAAGFDEPAMVGFLGFRVLENAAIFALAWLLYRRFGAGRYAAALGLALLAFAMTQAHYHSALAFDTYAEIAVYLAAGLLIVSGRHAWIVPLTVVGTLNRETCGLVPIMLLARGVQLGPRTPEGQRALRLGALALLAWGVTFWAVRWIVGPGPLIHPEGRDPGLDLLGLNLGRGLTWDHLFRTWTVVPLLAALRWRAWPGPLRAFAVAVVPAWIALHLLLGVVAETRLMLVPYALVFVPGAVCGLRSARTVAPR